MHAVPHAPQLLESLVRSTHALLQLVRPVVHAVVQTPLEHTLGEEHVLPQPPQFAGLVSGSTQVVPHTISPAAQPLVSPPPVSRSVSVETVVSPEPPVSPAVVSSTTVVSSTIVESSILVSVPPPVVSSTVAVSGVSPVPLVSSLPHPTVKPTAMNSHAAEFLIVSSPPPQSAPSHSAHDSDHRGDAGDDCSPHLPFDARA